MDRIPPDSTTARDTVVAAWNNVSLFYNQVSFGALTVQVDIFNNWHTLSGNFNDYIDADNIRQDVLSRLMAEAVNHAQSSEEEWHLDDYQLIVCVINLNSVGESIRAWGGSSTNNFRYDDLSNNITTTNPINELWVETNSDREQLAQEMEHNIVSNSFVLPDIFTNWVPVLRESTCLKVLVSQQSGEISGGNTSFRENVFGFEEPAARVPEAVYIPVAVRNPSNESTIVRMSVTGVKIGYIIQFPHEWLWLDPLEERRFYLTVVPWLDYPVYKAVAKRYKQNEDDYSTKILVKGYLPKTCKKKMDITGD